MQPASTNYFIRVKNIKGQPKLISLVRKVESGRYYHLAGLDIQTFDKEIWVADNPASEALTVAINWLSKKYKHSLGELTGVDKAAIKTARKNGAAFTTIAKIHNISASTARKVTHQRGTTTPTPTAA